MPPFFEHLSFDQDRLVVILLALLIEAVVGRMSWFFRVVPHPARLFIGIARGLERRLDRARRGAGAVLARGAIVTVFQLLLAAGLGAMLTSVTTGLATGGGWIEVVVLVLFLAQRGSYGEASRAVRALSREGPAAARDVVSAFHDGNAAGLDAHGICRAAIEQLSRGLARWVVAPVFWYFLLGLVGLLMYVAVATTARVIAKGDARRAGFGYTVARLEILLTWLPARIAGVFVVFAAIFTPTANPARAWRVLQRQARGVSTPSLGCPMAAMAGALGLELGGANVVDGETATWIGEGTPRAEIRDAHRALMLHGFACVLHGVVFACLTAINFAL
jgi:adenosylcobinamide-phosphate synthase